MKRVLVLVCMALLMVSFVSAQNPTLETVCRWGTFSHGRLFSWQTWHHVEFTGAALLTSISRLDASDKFDYDAGGYTPTWELTLTSASGAHRVDVWTRADDPLHVYLFAYRSATPDANGGSWGRHGCPYGAFRMSMATWNSLIARMTNDA